VRKKGQSLAHLLRIKTDYHQAGEFLWEQSHQVLLVETFLFSIFNLLNYQAHSFVPLYLEQ